MYGKISEGLLGKFVFVNILLSMPITYIPADVQHLMLKGQTINLINKKMVDSILFLSC